MTDQLALDGVPTDPAIRLTQRQRYALEHIGAHAPVPSDELGALLHELRDTEARTHHLRDERCTFCKGEGAGMGGRLRDLGLVRFRKGAGWYVPGLPERRETQESRLDGEFPDGY